MSIPPLSWLALDALPTGPVVLAGPTGPMRTRALSCLATECARVGATVLWVGAQTVARPLAWWPVVEQYLDARPVRPVFGEVAWPGVNPFDLLPDHLSGWLAAAAGVTTAGERRRIARAIDRLLGRAAGASLSWSAPSFSLGVAQLERLIPHLTGAWSTTSAEPHALRNAAAETTTLEFDTIPLTVIAGHARDLAARVPETLLALLLFVSRALDDPSGPALLVLDGWLDLVSDAAARTLVHHAALDLAGRAGARVLVASDEPFLWGSTPTGLALLDASRLVAVTSLPERHVRGGVVPCLELAADTVAVLRRDHRPAAWERVSLPRLADRF